MGANRLLYLTRDDWMLISAKTQRCTYKLGEEIIRQGSLGDRMHIIRSGEASVELAGTSSRTVVATLGPEDICGDMAFLEKGRTTAAVIAKSEEVQTDQIMAIDLREIFNAFPRLASRFYMSLAIVLAVRLRHTSRELAREMSESDRRCNEKKMPFS
jgi:CRP-like cAMP-binding protein